VVVARVDTGRFFDAMPAKPSYAVAATAR